MAISNFDLPRDQDPKPRRIWPLSGSVLLFDLSISPRRKAISKAYTHTPACLDWSLRLVRQQQSSGGESVKAHEHEDRSALLAGVAKLRMRLAPVARRD
jgi:hypothetical protein